MRKRATGWRGFDHVGLFLDNLQHGHGGYLSQIEAAPALARVLGFLLALAPSPGFLVRCTRDWRYQRRFRQVG